jgi:hypothetical protein
MIFFACSNDEGHATNIALKGERSLRGSTGELARPGAARCQPQEGLAASSRGTPT